MDVEQRGLSCISCRRRVLQRVGARPNVRSHRLTLIFLQNHPYVFNILERIEQFEFADEDRICHACLLRFQRRQAQEQPAPEQPIQELPAPVQPIQAEDVEMQDNPPPVAVNDQAVQVNRETFPVPGYSRAPINIRRCLIANCANQALQRVDTDLRAHVLDKNRFYIPRDVRICEEHSLLNVWHEIELNVSRVVMEFSPNQMSDMMKLSRKNKLFLNFERFAIMSDNLFYFYIGVSKPQFQELLQSTPSLNNQFKKPAKALATVLVKLRSGDSNERLCKLFRMCRETFEQTMSKVRSCLINEFVPNHLGLDHINREDVIAKSLLIPTTLFGNPESPLNDRKSIVILDGTYIYLQKSSNYHFQRKSYSLHKWRNLVKPFLMVCPNGYIIEIYGLYEATKSDANILKDIVNNEYHPFHWYFKQGDVFILDRGFRDAIEDVERLGYKTYMPITKNEGETQLTTRQANESRKVTMVRWVVEIVNGKLKNKFRQLRHQYFNRATPHLLDEIRIAATLLNAFGVPCVDHELVDEILNEYHNRYPTENRLAEYVLANNLNRLRVSFQPMNANALQLHFPLLSLHDLVVYGLGSYQLKQARSYYGEHVKPDGSYIIEIYEDLNINEIVEYGFVANNCWLLRGRIRSRHVNSRIYYTYILVDEGVVGSNAILGHYCSCIIGKRTLGCCSHVMTILWYIGWGRHQNNISPPSAFIEEIVRQDLENEIFEENDHEDYVLGI